MGLRAYVLRCSYVGRRGLRRRMMHEFGRSQSEPPLLPNTISAQRIADELLGLVRMLRTRFEVPNSAAQWTEFARALHATGVEWEPHELDRIKLVYMATCAGSHPREKARAAPDRVPWGTLELGEANRLRLPSIDGGAGRLSRSLRQSGGPGHIPPAWLLSESM